MPTSNLNNPNWIPLIRSLMPTDIRLTFDSEFLDISSFQAWVIDEFRKQSGTAFEPQTWSREALARFRQWWWFQLEQGDFIHRKLPRLETVLHCSLSSKASAIAQRQCPICSGMMPADAQFPISILPVRIAPESRQVLSSVNWAGFQMAVKTWFEKRTVDLGPSRNLCIAITYVLGTTRNDRDLDNMTKAVMDAFSRAVGFNDRDIHHLDIVKLSGDTPEEYMIIRVAPSYLKDTSTVMLPFYDGSWGVGEALKLSDFV